MTQGVQPVDVTYNLPQAGDVMPLPFRYLAGSEVSAFLLDNNRNLVKTLVYGVDFIVTPDGDTAENIGTMTLFNTDADATKIHIVRSSSLVQLYRASPGAIGVEASLDRRTLIDQENRREMQRTFKLPLSEGRSASIEYPVPGKLQIGDGDGWIRNGLSVDQAFAIAGVGSVTGVAEFGSTETMRLAGPTLLSVGQRALVAGRNAFVIFPAGSYAANGTTVIDLVGIAGQAISSSLEQDIPRSSDPRDTNFFRSLYGPTAKLPISYSDGEYRVELDQVAAGNVINGGGIKLKVNAPDDSIPVEAFGAKGDGITDDAAAINAALQFASARSFGTVRLSAKVYAIGSRISVPEGVTLRGPGWGHVTLGIAATLKMKSTMVAQPLGSGSVICGLLFEDVKAPGCIGIQVDMVNAPETATGILSAGMWRATWHSIAVINRNKASQTGIDCCLKNIGWFWNQFTLVRSSGSAGRPFRLRSAKPFGGSAIGQPTQTVFTNFRVDGGPIGMDIDGVGAGIVFLVCQAEQGDKWQDAPTNSIRGIGVKVRGANPLSKPLWLSGEINGYGSGFDGEIRVLDEPVFAGPPADDDKRYTNGASATSYKTVSNNGLVMRDESQKQRAVMNMIDEGIGITVPSGVATTLYACDTGTAATNVDALTFELIYQQVGNGARWGRIKFDFTARADQSFEIEPPVVKPVGGAGISPVFSMSGNLLQVTQTTVPPVTITFRGIKRGISRRG